MGISISFESAIVPQWKEGTIRLKNVAVSRNAETQKQYMIAERKAKGLNADVKDEEVDRNFTYFDMKMENVDVTLSLWRWLDGEWMI